MGNGRAGTNQLKNNKGIVDQSKKNLETNVCTAKLWLGPTPLDHAPAVDRTNFHFCR